MADTMVAALRDQVALEADWHMSHAEQLDQIAAEFLELGYARRSKAITVAAMGCRQRARILREIFSLTSRPEATAS